MPDSVLESQRRKEAVISGEPQIVSVHALKAPYNLTENKIGGSWTVAVEQAKSSLEEQAKGSQEGIIQHCLTTPTISSEQFLRDADTLNLSAATFHYPVEEMVGQPDLIFNRVYLDRFVERLLSIATKGALYSHMALAGVANLEVSKNLGIPHTFIPHALEIMSAENFPDRRIKPLRLIAEYALAKNATHIVTNTEYERRYYAEHYSQLPSALINDEILKRCNGSETIFENYILDALVLEKVNGKLPTYDDIYNKCVPNPLGVDTERFSQERRAVLREQFRNDFCHEIAIPASDDTIIVGCVGRYHPQKDQITAIKAFKDAFDRLPNGSKANTYMVFVGPNATEENSYFREVSNTVEEVCPELRERIFFRGAEGSDKMNAIFDIRLDATRFETFGLATAEALMAGCPTVMASNPVYEELYAGRGLKLIDLPNRDDVGEFGESLAGLIKSREDRESYGRLCHDAASRFTWGESVRRLNEVFRADLK